MCEICEIRLYGPRLYCRVLEILKAGFTIESKRDDVLGSRECRAFDYAYLKTPLASSRAVTWTAKLGGPGS